MMNEHTLIPHKLLKGLNSEMYWGVSLRGRNFIQVLNREADEVKTYPIKEGSNIDNGIKHDMCTQLMRIDDDNTLLCFDFEGGYRFHHLEKD